MANIHFILDRSGSMESCWDDTIGGFNSFLKSQSEFDSKITLVQFDHEYIVCYKDMAIKEAPVLTKATFEPRGNTALLDAIGRTIKECEEVATVVILTDGHENASRKFTKSHVKDLIDQKTKEGWTFVYLGANQDAFAEAGSLGIAPGCTMDYDTRRTPEAFKRLSEVMSSQASGRSIKF